MNWDALSGLVRHVLTFGGGFFVGNGILTDNELTTAVSAILSLIGLGWSVWDKLKNKKPAA